MRFATRRQPQLALAGAALTLPAPWRHGRHRHEGVSPVTAGRAATLPDSAVTAGGGSRAGIRSGQRRPRRSKHPRPSLPRTRPTSSQRRSPCPSRARESLPCRHSPRRSFRSRRPIRPASPSSPGPGPPGPGLRPRRPARTAAAARPRRWAEANGGRRGRAGHTRSRHLRHVRRAHADRARAAAARHAARLSEATLTTPATRAIRFAGITTAASAPLRRARRNGSARADGLGHATCHQRARESATRLPARAVTAARSTPTCEHQQWNEHRGDGGQRGGLAP